MAESYYRQSNNNFLLALLAIVIIAAVAFGVYWLSGSERDTTHITLPQNKIEVHAPAAPSLPAAPAQQ
jgi:hypothetical protein